MHRPSDSIGEKEIANRQLIAAAQRWEPRAQTGLYTFYYAALDSHCKRFFPHHQDREDALQEIWVKIFRNIGQFTPSNEFISRIKTVAANHSIDILRKLKTREWWDNSSFESIPDNEFGPDSQMLFSEWHSHITTWFQTIYANEFCGEAMRLRYQEELPIHEIARILWQNENTTKAQLRRWRQQLIKNLSASCDNTILISLMRRHLFSEKSEKASPHQETL